MPERISYDGQSPVGDLAKQPLKERLTSRRVTDAALLSDNTRPETVRGLQEWLMNRQMGSIFNVYHCSDSRIAPLFPEAFTNLIPTIATAGHDEYVDFRPHAGKIIAVHWPCGGAEAKTHGHVDPDTGLGDYVDNKIKHANIIHQALSEAEQAIEIATEPVLAVVVDNTSGRIIPIAHMQKGEPYRFAQDVIHFDPAHMNDLADLPQLPDDQVGGFKKFLQKCEEKRKEFKTKYPDFSETQKSQNPSVLVIDTEDNPPLAVRYPELFSDPGSAFRIVVEGDQDFNVTDTTVSTALDQAEYPLQVAKFSALKTTIIQAPTLDKAREIAKKFVDRQAGRDWLAQQDTQMILIGGTGLIEEMQTLTTPEQVLIRPLPSKGAIYPRMDR